MSDGLSEGLNDAIRTTVADLVDRLLKQAAGWSKAQKDKARVKLTLGFADYIKETRRRCSRVKTLINRAEPIAITDVYVPVVVRAERRTFSEAELIEFIVKGNQSIITGPAGCGKSMTMKHIFITLCDQPQDCIPVFVELRHVKFADTNALLQFIQEQIAHFAGKLHPDAFKEALLRGRLVLLLDGFDEIPFNEREMAQSQLVRLSEDFPSCPIIVSSRPDTRFISWHGYTEFRLLPLTIEQVEALVSKIHYSDKTKANFIKRIKSGLFTTHRELLSNPLLATMMLMTFEEFSEIPSKMHIFYRQAFEVLFARHDATKTDFHRAFHTGLAIDDFERIFSNFCMMTFLDKKYSFTGENTQYYMQRALEYDGCSASPSSLISDLIDNICIMLRDGDNIVFIHRSFQEYFCASFLAARDVPEFMALVEEVSRHEIDFNVINLLVEMNREVFERKYMIPKLAEFERELSEAKEHPASALGLFCSGLGADGNGHYSVFTSLSVDLPEKFQVWRMLGDFYDQRISLAALSWACEGEPEGDEPQEDEHEWHHIELEDLTSEILEDAHVELYIDELIKDVRKVRKSLEARQNDRTQLLSERLIQNP